jgi:hypothetical protein
MSPATSTLAVDQRRPGDRHHPQGRLTRAAGARLFVKLTDLTRAMVAVADDLRFGEGVGT